MALSRKFSKKDRLLDKEDFDAVFESAHLRAMREKNILHLPPYVIYRNNTEKAPRLGISVARRIIKKANQRNRIKRVIREFFRMNKNEMSGDYIIKVVARPRSDDHEFLTAPLYKMIQKNPKLETVK